MALHINRQFREQNQLEDLAYSQFGDLPLTDITEAYTLAKRINNSRLPSDQLLPAQMYALSVLDDCAREILAAYRTDIAPQLHTNMSEWLRVRLGEATFARLLTDFVRSFPPPAVYRDEYAADTYLNGVTDGVSNREHMLEALVLVWLTNQNKAAVKLKALFDDAILNGEGVNSHYQQLIKGLQPFYAEQPKLEAGPTQHNLLELLNAPLNASPDDLIGQLDHIAQHWPNLSGRQRLTQLVDNARKVIHLLHDENRWIANEQTSAATNTPNVQPDGHAVGGHGFSAAQPPQFNDELAAEPEQFTPDRAWMPQMVLMAKNSYVWLDQLSKKYQRNITRLDQIPDEELDQLQRWGITGLWLIGLWERSKASRTIKQWMGNTDAVASAYSLHDYRIADDLGGPEACANLRDRAAQRGIRLASDMVPNHMGIDSAWVADHPDWFLSVDEVPYPSYTFGGQDLSADSRVSVHLEDHYWNHSDAAVVFKLHNHATNQTQYVYHGNDGTSTPWNDTAQLNYLKPEVREAVIQTILHVARQFSVIRFDAAMTLAKRHIQRLWFPGPGATGSIPSRQNHAMSKAEFDALMPNEFWRDVVDRCAIEAPDTLLLAEAFWMMEGYFVRTLGMHRVYNSSFMHMLRDEKNAGYRAVIKDTMAFDPQILKRYVSFMNNPDEKTAVEQFGRGEKYFGICAMLATLPGLPMFGHGQFEGFSEKYGMEFRRPMWDEQVDTGLMEHHERVIAPLLKRRAMFAEVDHFVLYDFVGNDTAINEDVFAYTNCAIGPHPLPSLPEEEGSESIERALILYNNRMTQATGWVQIETEIKPQFDHEDAPLESRKAQIGKRKSLIEALRLNIQDNTFSIFRDQMSGQQFIRSNSELRDRGLYAELGGYKCHVFLDWQQVLDTDGSYARLTAHLGGKGCDDIEKLKIENEKLRIEEEVTEFKEFEVLIHSTHEAGLKIGGIGAVLDGLLSAPSYVKSVKRTVLVGPMHTSNSTEMERLFSPKNGVKYFYYFADRGLSSCPAELALRLSAIERDWRVRICYARRAFGDANNSAEHEVLLVDATDLPRYKLNDFKFGVWERFGLDCNRYQNNPEFDEYMALAVPSFLALQAILGIRDDGFGMKDSIESSNPQSPILNPQSLIPKPTIIAHEFMGLPLWYAAELSARGEFASAYVAHEVASVRAAVEGNSGHDVRFYNIMRQAMRHGLQMEQVLGDSSGYFKHPMTQTAAQCDYVLAVSDITADELRFMDWRFRNRSQRGQHEIALAYNGVPSQRFNLDERYAASEKLKDAAHALAGFRPNWVFTHVTRLAQSKALWRDIAVMRHLDYLLAQRGETAAFLVVSSNLAQGRSTSDARRMHQAYGWPRNHYSGMPDLVDQEIPLWHSMMSFNGYARAARAVFVNQFGFSHDRLGGAIPEGIEFSDLRKGSDVEFGQSIYEPFGIAQIEPLTFGALCVISDVCGCKGIIASGKVPDQNLIIANYTQLPYALDLNSAVWLGQSQRDDLEARAAWEVANQIIERLPRSDAARQALLDSGYALAKASSWDVVARTMFLPGIV